MRDDMGCVTWDALPFDVCDDSHARHDALRYVIGMHMTRIDDM